MNTLSLYVQRNGEVISADSRSLISKRYCTVTSAMNREFWNITSDRQNSIYVGSYGRGTAIDTSDIDILMSLPESYYDQFNSVYGNGQSRLLQAVRQELGVNYTQEQLDQIKRAEEQRLRQRRMEREAKERERLAELYKDCDGRFAFIAGYTDGGAPYGVMWEEVGIDPGLPFEEKVKLYHMQMLG